MVGVSTQDAEDFEGQGNGEEIPQLKRLDGLGSVLSSPSVVQACRVDLTPAANGFDAF